MKRGLGTFLRMTAMFGGIALLVAVVLLVVVSSDWFKEQVRLRVIQETEKATGGTVTIDSFDYEWKTLTAEIRSFVIRGDEPAEADPLFRAELVVVGLKVVSLFDEEVDIALLEIHQPALSIRKMPGGGTNIPAREATEGKGRDIAVTILNLAVREFRLVEGSWQYEDSAGTFDLDGSSLEASAAFQADPSRYELKVDWDQMLMRAPWSTPVAFDANLDLIFEEEWITVRSARFATGASSIETAGRVETGDEFAATMDLEASVAVADIREPLRLPVEPEGAVRIDGDLSYRGGEDYSFEGRTSMSGLAVRNRRVTLDDIGGTGAVVAGPGVIALSDLNASLLDGTFTGKATVRDLASFQAEGEVAGFSLARLLPRVRVNNLAWNALLHGPVSVAGNFSGPVTGSADMTLEPTAGDEAVEGNIRGAFDTAAGDVTFEQSRLATGTSRIDFSGTLREGIRLSLYSENILEVFPPLRLFGVNPPDPFPVRLQDGVAQFGGLITGVLGAPRIAGHIAAGPILYQGRVIEHGAADFDIDRDRLRLRSLTLRQESTEVRGDFELGMNGWRYDPSSELSGEFEIPAGSVSTVLALANAKAEVAGAIAGSARLSGTVGKPALTGEVEATKVTAWGEKVDRVNAAVYLSKDEIRIQRGRIHAGEGEMQAQATYELQGEGWGNGELEFTGSATDFRLGQFAAIREVRESLDGKLQGDLKGLFRFQDKRPRLESLDGQVETAGLSLDGREIGQALITAEMQSGVLVAQARADIKGAAVRGYAQWQLERESFGLGEVSFTNLTLDALQDLGLFGGRETDIYLDGSLDGQIGFVGPVLEPSKWRGMAKISRLEVTPVAGDRESDRDLTMRNEGAWMFAIEPSRITVETARIHSTDTDLEISGTLSYLRRNPWNLRLNGVVDLAVLTAFRQDLLAEGRSTIDTVIRGSLLQPQVNGQLEFEDGSFYLRDLPNGLEQVNGTIRFNRTRATFEKFSSRTGGGDLELGGFIGFGGEDWVYRLQAKANRVRVRYPEGVSTLLNANLDLTGSSTRSLLSGEVQVTRAAFNPSSDLGSILSQSVNARPPAGIDNPFLQGMQFDLNITTSSNAEFVTSLTKDTEIEAELRLRGTIVRPVILGEIDINRGEIQFFGNRYNIVQGEVNFFNPVKIEPVLTMDLETRIRSYTVMMNFSGPLGKLNFSYRSDPPLQSQEIIALLTVGRTPTYAGSRSTSSPAGTSYFDAGGSSFLGHALTAPVSSRLERFFGVSRIKIDPQLTGVDNTPETHVTIEQQVSRDITLTYVTNLTQTQQQIVRIEWNFHPDWSVYAIRDSNGVFGMDFIYRRRFK